MHIIRATRCTSCGTLTQIPVQKCIDTTFRHEKRGEIYGHELLPLYTLYTLYFFSQKGANIQHQQSQRSIFLNAIIFVYLCDQHPVRVTCRICVYAPDQLEVPFLRISLIDLFSVLFDLRVLIHSFSLLFNPPSTWLQGLASKRRVGNLLSRS